MSTTAIRAFRKLCLSTLIAVYFLILAGGIVRTTGSGMGCPDWPKCFGQWIPPTSEKELPTNYKEVYSAQRDKKNQKFIKYLQLMGLKTTADKLVNDKSVLVEANFNPVKTWIEYINRLAGAVIGLFIVALFLKSWSLRKINIRLLIISGILLVSVIFQGWFGSIVVSTNLTTWTITVHMLIALAIIALLVYLYSITNQEATKMRAKPIVLFTLAGCMGLLLTQIVFGTEVRSAIDRIASSGLARTIWIGQLGNEFILHRSFSWIVLILHVILIAQLQKTKAGKTLTRGVIILILTTLLSGVGMAYFSVPAFLQPVHLLAATITFGMQLMLFFRMNTSNEVTNE